jgi:ectoine hydroxylase-related dioxygenase (phytanoyl-CoA dioxygenase family)
MVVARAPHEWNRAFEWIDHDGPFTTISPEQAKAYDEVGYFVVEDAFDTATIAELDRALAPGDEMGREFLASRDAGRFGVTGLDTQVIAPHAVVRSDVARTFCSHPALGGIARDLLGADVRLYWDQSVYKVPHGAEPVLWHQDNGYTYVEPQSYLTCWVAITDATLENGCVHVMPGVHREGTLHHEHTDIGEECWGDWNDAVAVPVRAGSIVVFTSLTPHATPVNRTDVVRKAYIVQYAPDGAVALRGTPRDAGSPARVRQDDPRRQFSVVSDGALVQVVT